MNGQSEVGVLGERFEGKATSGNDGLATHGADGPGHDGDAIPKCIGAAIQIESTDVFQVLAAGEEGSRIPHTRVTGYRTGFFIVEGIGELGQRILLELGVGIHENNDIAIGVIDSTLKCMRLAGIGLFDQADAGILNRLDHIGRVVAGAIVDNHHLKRA